MIHEKDKEAAEKYAKEQTNNISASIVANLGYLTACESKNKQMVEFAEWILKNNIKQSTKSLWIMKDLDVDWNSKFKTSEQLLTEFLKTI